MSDRKQNCLSYWFPKLEAAGLPVPKTEIVLLPSELQRGIIGVFDGTPLPESTKPFFDQLRTAAQKLGLPCFLRTGQTSAKHNWKETCYLAQVENVENHVLSLVEFSECADFLGLPWDVWCVRELLPTKPVMIAELYGNMPICREFRFFVNDGEIECAHPYWPLEALIEGTDRCPPNIRKIYYAMCDMPGDLFRSERDPPPELEALASAAGKAVGGRWSVDVLETERGWYVTDMALADNSFHWPGCVKAK